MRSRIILTACSTSRGGSWSWLDDIFSINSDLVIRFTAQGFIGLVLDFITVLELFK
jgi:hypothetical protein